MKMEMNYVAPELEVLEVMVERGFEASVGSSGGAVIGGGGFDGSGSPF